jgi:hypothetical protein
MIAQTLINDLKIERKESVTIFDDDCSLLVPIRQAV